MGFKETMSGHGLDRMPDWSFRVMSFFFALRDMIFDPGKKLDRFGIEKGQTVIDYGCGPGSHVVRASHLAGPGGRILAIDLHELAVRAVEEKIDRLGLTNVRTLLIRDYRCPLDDGIADLVYALDMFHMVAMPDLFLGEVRRLLKDTGRFILEDGHQPRSATLEKVARSGLWRVVEQTDQWLVCAPL
jgi:ubiquinone/menaquinone biosynthesis C-methylase UbiE